MVFVDLVPTHIHGGMKSIFSLANTHEVMINLLSNRCTGGKIGGLFVSLPRKLSHVRNIVRVQVLRSFENSRRGRGKCHYRRERVQVQGWVGGYIVHLSLSLLFFLFLRLLHIFFLSSANNATLASIMSLSIINAFFFLQVYKLAH